MELPFNLNPSKKPQKTSELLPSAPFDDTRSDFILRSSDGANFRIFKAILSLAASPVFAAMSNIFQPTLHDRLSFVTLSEESKKTRFGSAQSLTRVKLGDAHTLI